MVKLNRAQLYYLLLELEKKCEKKLGKALDNSTQHKYFGYSNKIEINNQQPPLGSIAQIVRSTLMEEKYMKQGFDINEMIPVFETQSLINAMRAFNRGSTILSLTLRYLMAYLYFIGFYNEVEGDQYASCKKGLDRLVKQYKNIPVPSQYHPTNSPTSGPRSKSKSEDKTTQTVRVHFQDSHWYYYSFKPHNNEIIRAVLHIHHIEVSPTQIFRGEVDLDNPNPGFPYSGSIEVILNRRIIRLELRTNSGKGITCYGFANMDSKDPVQIILGEMLAYTDQNEIYSADVILQRTDETAAGEILPWNDPKIPDSIRVFFSSALYSQSKVPQYINSLEALNKYNNSQ
ncbi:MAG: hypothetical protein HKN87_19890 [Saprospiraceae bacterium]|nr:hypothetical protein [Saprospiraceae bacterium]